MDPKEQEAKDLAERPDCVDMSRVPPDETAYDDRYTVSTSTYYKRAIDNRTALLEVYAEQLRRANKDLKRWGDGARYPRAYAESAMKELTNFWKLYLEAFAKGE